MPDTVTTTQEPLTNDEIQKAMLHFAAALHQLQDSVQQLIQHARTPSDPHAIVHSERSPDRSRKQLSKSLEILVPEYPDE